MLKAKMTKKMIDFYAGNLHDVNHFLKVYSFASTIGRLEGLDQATQDILEMAAIVHDIAIPYCRAHYGNAAGNLQEKETPGVLKPFLAEFGLPKEVEDRIIYLVSHHHTYTNVDGMDYQILLEADYLVNAFEGEQGEDAIREFRKNVFKTESGRQLLDSMYLSK